MRKRGKILYSRAGHRRQNGACALHVVYLRLHTQHVTLVAFVLQEWLHERASTLRHTYITCLVMF